MKDSSLVRSLVLMFVFSITSLVGFAQEPPLEQDRRQERPRQDIEQPNLLAQLGLSKDQIQQFRLTNSVHRPLMQAAQQRLREANRELDLVIYADSVSEDDFRARLSVFQQAQAEVNRLRFANELAIRKILTPDQLVRFREMRRRFAEQRDRNEPRRRAMPNNDRPMDDVRKNERMPRDQAIRPEGRSSRPIN